MMIPKPTMQNKLQKALFLILFFLASLPLAAQQIDQGILRKVDAYRGFEKDDFMILVNLSNESEEAKRLEVYTNREKSVVKFLEPLKEKGRLLLNEDVKNMWFYIPGNKRLVRLSPSQRLIGKVSIGDVLSVKYSSDYEVVEIVENEDNTTLLQLKGKTSNSLYDKISLRIDSRTHKPIDSTHFALSGKALKSVEYTEYKKFKGGEKLSKALVKDEISKNDDTLIEYLDYKTVKLPRGFYAKENLENL